MCNFFTALKDVSCLSTKIKSYPWRRTFFYAEYEGEIKLGVWQSNKVSSMYDMLILWLGNIMVDLMDVWCNFYHKWTSAEGASDHLGGRRIVEE